MKKHFLLITLFFFAIRILAQIPDGYYDDAQGLSGEELKAALHSIVKTGHVKFPYTSSSTDVWDLLKETDRDPSNSENVILIYKGISVDAAQEYNNGNGWTREHIWAKSHGFPDETDYGYTDIHHLRPCDNSVNTDRGTKDFDNGGTQHPEATECYYDTDSWEPRDAVKGDVARMMFYMTVRYEGDGGSGDDYDLELVDYTGTSGTNFGKLSTLLAWHEQDPVDDFERNRNNVIYNYQKNRNPFIDHPEYVDYIWGNEIPNEPSITQIQYTPQYPLPGEAISVSAKATDNNSITAVILKWGTDGANFTNTITMTDGNNDDIYESNSSIPGQSEGTTIYFKIEATDNESNTTVSDVVTVEITGATNMIDVDFSTCPPDDWTLYTISGNKDWTCETGSIGINAYGGDAPSNDWFISPAINLTQYADETLSFDSWTKYADSFYPPLIVKYSTNYSGSGNPEDASWTGLSPTLSPENSETWTNSGNIDLSVINSSNVHIAFIYTSTGNGASTCAYWKIDNIIISGDPSSDVDPPVFANGFPNISNITTQGFNLNVNINEAGKVFYKIAETGTDEPTINEVTASSHITVSGANETTSEVVSGLNHSTSYDVYFIAEDDETTPNRQSELTKITASTLNVDTEPPVFITEYPVARNIGGTSFDVFVKLDEPGKVYVLSLNDEATTPTINEIKAGTELVINEANIEYHLAIGNQTPESSIDIYVIAEDDETTPNIQANATKLDVTLGSADTNPPVFSTEFPKAENISSSAVDFTAQLNENGIVYFICQLAADPAPTIDQLKQASELNIFLPNTSYSQTIRNLTPESDYTIYCIARDDETNPNIQATVTSINFTTLGLPPSITSQPQNTEVCVNESALLEVTATSTTTINYQWYKNNEIINGATENEYQITEASIVDNGNYFCSLINDYDTVFTDTVLLSVSEAPYAGPDTNFMVCVGTESVDFFDYLLGADQDGIFFDNSQSGALTRNIFYVSEVDPGSYNFTYIVEGDPCDDDYAVINVTIDECSGIKNISGKNIKAYFDKNGFLTITSDDRIQRIQVYNLYGQKLAEKSLSSAHSTTYKFSSENTSGIYLIRIQAVDEIKTIKILKNN